MRKVTSFAMKVNGYQLVKTIEEFDKIVDSFDGVCYQNTSFPVWLKVIDTYYDDFESNNIVTFDFISPMNVE